MNIELISNDPWLPTLVIPVDKFPLIIGRNGMSDVVIDNRWMSDCHCELTEQGGRLFVRDLNSKYGTYVNGRMVTQTMVSPGDDLLLGIRSLVVTESPIRSPHSTS